MTSAPPKTTKNTRWGCLAAPLVILLFCVAGFIYDSWRERQPREFHLRRIFRESGFEVPDYVTDLEGYKGIVDFQGDFEAWISFTVKPEDLDRFMNLPEKQWQSPSSFQPLKKDEIYYKFQAPAGAFMIAHEGSQYRRKYAVDKTTYRIYFYRASW